jgi:hypothetical protein
VFIRNNHQLYQQHIIQAYEYKYLHHTIQYNTIQYNTIQYIHNTNIIMNCCNPPKTITTAITAKEEQKQALEFPHPKSAHNSNTTSNVNTSAINYNSNSNSATRNSNNNSNSSINNNNDATSNHGDNNGDHHDEKGMSEYAPSPPFNPRAAFVIHDSQMNFDALL